MSRAVTVKRSYWKTAAAAAGIIVVGGAGLYGVNTVSPKLALDQAQAEMTSIPSAQQRIVCPAQPQLVSGIGAGTDAAFTPGSSDEQAALSTVMISDLAGNLPWVQLGDQDLTPEVSQEDQQGPPAVISDSGESSRIAETSHSVEESLESSVVTSYPLGGRPALMNSVRSYTASDGDLSGMASTNCLIPRHEHWITGMTTVVGATAVVNVTNPTDTTAVVSMEYYGQNGRVSAPGAAGIVLGPSETRSFLMAGFAPDEQAVSVRVVSSGGAVAAHATQNYLYGLTPGGVDYLPATFNLSRNQTVTGYVAQSHATTQEFLSQGGRSISNPALMVTTPAATETTAIITAFDTDGPVALPNDGQVTIPAQSTVEYPLEDLPAGTYTFRVEADNLIMAATRAIKGSEEADVAYNASYDSLGSTNVVALPREGYSTLNFGQDSGESTVTITAINADGKVGTATTLELEGGTSARLTQAQLSEASGMSTPVGALISVTGDRVHGAVTMTGEGNQISSIPIRSIQQTNTSVPVSLSE